MDFMNVTEAFKMIGDMWGLYKNYAGRKLSDEDYEVFVDETIRLHGKYKTTFSKDIVLAVVNEIDRSSRYFGEEKK